MKSLNVLILLACCWLVSSCAKSTEQEQYGVSISAPDLSKSPDAVSFGEHLDLLGMSNGFGFDLFRTYFDKDTTKNNFAFSALFLYRDWYLINSDRDYLNEIADYASLNDTSFEQMSERLSSIEDLIISIDSSLNLSFDSTHANKDTLTFFQSFEFPLLYEDALKTISTEFYLEDTISEEREFFSLSDNFNFLLTEEEMIAEVPVGNGSFSLLMIAPLQLSLRNYALSLTEKKFIQLIEALQIRNTTVVFPSFEGFSEIVRLYPPKHSAISEFEDLSNIIVKTDLKFRQPNEALLQSMHKTLNEKMKNAGNGEAIRFDKPFIYLIKENNSHMVLLQGIFVK